MYVYCEMYCDARVCVFVFCKCLVYLESLMCLLYVMCVAVMVHSINFHDWLNLDVHVGRVRVVSFDLVS